MMIQCIFKQLKMYTMQLFLLIRASKRCDLEIGKQLFCFGLLSDSSIFQWHNYFFLHVHIQNSSVFLRVLIHLFCINSFIVWKTLQGNVSQLLINVLEKKPRRLERKSNDSD